MGDGGGGEFGDSCMQMSTMLTRPLSTHDHRDFAIMGNDLR